MQSGNENIWNRQNYMERNEEMPNDMYYAFGWESTIKENIEVEHRKIKQNQYLCSVPGL